MKRSFQVGSVTGIGIFLHWTFALLLAGVPALYLWQGATTQAALIGTAVVLGIFVCVVMHELGHALTARAFDVPTRDITLYPIGGIARLAEIPEEAMTEFWIAVAGPAVNVVLAGLLGALTLGLGLPLTPAALFDPAGLPVANVPATLLWANVALALFNMLPAFPMDGGRVLRALLATRFSFARATQIAANVGQAMALAFGALGLFSGNLILVFIAVFVYLGAQQAARQATFRQTTQGLRVGQAMMTRFQTLRTDEALGAGADALIAGTDHDFPVVGPGGAVKGLLTRSQLIEALSEHGRETTVGEAVPPEDVFTAEAAEALDDVFQRMRGRGHSTVPVTDAEGRLVGLLTMENVAELMMISSALGRDAAPSAAASERNGSELLHGLEADDEARSSSAQ